MRGTPPAHYVAARRIIGLLTVMLLLGGCSRPKYPEYQLNPAPTDALEVVIKLHDAPVGLDARTAYASYRIVNQTCLPVVTNFQGVQPAPKTHSVDVPLRKVDDSTYAFTVYLDQMEVRDYYGRGECHWEFNVTGSAFSLADAPNRVYFSVSSDLPSLQHDGGHSYYYVVDRESAGIDGDRYHSTGFSKDAFEKVPEERKVQTFAMTILSPTQGASK